MKAFPKESSRKRGRSLNVNKNFTVKKMVMAAMCLALCQVLPFLTGQLPQIAKAISPMHIPVFLAGFLCGWPLAMIVGFVAPLLRSALFGMPALISAISMAFELPAYGLITAVLYRMLPKKPAYLYVALISAMLGGRVVMGIANWIIYGVTGAEYTFQMFLGAAFINAVPALICHIVLIPVIIMALQKAKLCKD